MQRFFDIFFSLLAIVGLSPIFLVIVLLLRITGEGEVFYKQKRIGRQGKDFYIYKFATMLKNSELLGGTITLKNDPRVLPIGGMLRKSKLNELPQLINILIGDMSIVGPRPCLEKTIDEMPEWARQRFKVRPGLSGLAQTSGNVSATWTKRWEYDIRYIESQSLIFDLWLIIKTFFLIIVDENKFGKSV